MNDVVRSLRSHKKGAGESTEPGAGVGCVEVVPATTLAGSRFLDPAAETAPLRHVVGQAPRLCARSQENGVDYQ